MSIRSIFIRPGMRENWETQDEDLGRKLDGALFLIELRPLEVDPDRLQLERIVNAGSD